VDNHASVQPLLYSERDAAELLGVSAVWLRRDRLKKRLVPFVRLRGAIRYRDSDLRAFVDALAVEGGDGRPALATVITSRPRVDPKRGKGGDRRSPKYREALEAAKREATQ